MSLNYAQVQHLTREIKEAVEGAECTGVASAAPRVYVFSFLKNNKASPLLLSFEHGYVRLHLLENFPKSERSDSFARNLQGKIVGATLSQVTVLNEDRIVELTFSNRGKDFRLIAELLPRRPNCLLLDSKGHVLYSLHPTNASQYAFPEKPANHVLPEGEAVLLSSRETEKHYADMETDQTSHKRRIEIEKLLQQNVRKVEKRVKERLDTLEECKRYAEVHHEGELLQANLYQIKKGMKELEVTDWMNGDAVMTIPLDPKIEPKNLVAQIFRRAKRLHAGIPHAEEQLQKTEKDLLIARERLAEASSITDTETLEAYAESIGLLPKGGTSSPRKKHQEPAKPYHRFVSAAGMDIWVGKSAKDNDLLTFRHARGLDWWLHASDCPGSHVVLRCEKDQEPDHASVTDAAELALRFSKFKDQGKGEVSLTQVKGIVKVKGCPGKVMLSKHKTLYIDLNEERWNRLRRTKS